METIKEESYSVELILILWHMPDYTTEMVATQL